MKKIFLESLPRKGVTNIIDWFKSVGYKLRFIYDNIEGWIEIVDVKREGRKTMLGLKYLDYDIKYMFSGNMLKGQLGEILRINTSEYYYNVGDIIEVSTGKIKIKELIRGKDNNKEYIYECLECGWKKGKINEGNLKKKQGCGCCSNKVPVLGINTIWDTDPWMLPYFINSEDTKTRTFGNTDTGLLHCPICKVPKPNMKVVTLHRDKDVHCEVCWDGFSYGEKFTYSFLKQLGIKVKRHKYFEWSKNVYSEIESLCGNKEYDFFIDVNKEKIIIETNGLQHYEECSFSRRSYFEEVENDKLKKKLALDNEFSEDTYIVIDCRYSNLEYIKNSVLNNMQLKNKFDLSKINWEQCNKEALEPYLIKAVQYYNEGIDHMKIAEIMEIDFKTVKRYLKRAREHGLCNFKTGQEIHNENFNKVISLWKDGIHDTNKIKELLPSISRDSIGEYLRQAEKDGLIEYNKYINSADKKPIKNIEYNKEFVSINQASNMSKEIFGVKLYREQLRKSCDTGQVYNGLHFQYINNDISANKENKI
jgi:Mn-dependent DtxR family transcriptional regulator